jgi:hypothetical protein
MKAIEGLSPVQLKIPFVISKMIRVAFYLKEKQDYLLSLKIFNNL